jgi:uncharacterized membrane protein (UPF0127 family)
VVAGAALAFLVLAACSEGDGSGTVTPTLAPGQTAVPVTASPVPSLEGTPQSLETTTITFETNGEEVDLEVQIADETHERATGLMWVQSMPEGEGMLFVWPEDHSTGFWMRNTYIPLTVAFAREDGTIIHIENMEPLTDDLHTPDGEFRYAVEANQGWFEENAIGLGDRVTSLP